MVISNTNAAGSYITCKMFFHFAAKSRDVASFSVTDSQDVGESKTWISIRSSMQLGTCAGHHTKAKSHGAVPC